MKKQLIYSSVAAAIVLTGMAGGVISDVIAKPSEVTETFVATTPSLASNVAPGVAPKDETVYLMANADGTVRQTFVGSTIYNGDATVPFDFSVKYYLDDAEISASELAGKSGHVRIVYTAESTASYLDKNIPFLAVTGLSLSKTVFSNINLVNGKIVKDGDDCLVVGYYVPGLNSDLDTDFLPSEFVVEADVQNFVLGTTYTVLTNAIFSDLDTSKLSDVDGLISSINQLGSGLDQIITGATSLEDGLKAALDGVKTLADGTDELADGISTVADGSAALAQGLGEITTNNPVLQAGAEAIITTTLASANAAGLPVTVTVENYSEVISTTIETLTTTLAGIPDGPATAETKMTLQGQIASLTQAKGLLDLSTGIIGYTSAVELAATGATDLSEGLALINSKMPELISGITTLTDGATKLYEGSAKLHAGLDVYKTTGINRLVDFANQDLTNFTYNARRVVEASGSYHGFSNTSASSVRFIIKTASI